MLLLINAKFSPEYEWFFPVMTCMYVFAVRAHVGVAWPQEARPAGHVFECVLLDSCHNNDPDGDSKQVIILLDP